MSNRPKDFNTWSAEMQEKWKEKKRKIARKSYAKNAVNVRRKVRLHHASVRGTLLAKDGYAKKRVKRPETRKCTGRQCSSTVEYKVWVSRGKVCKSCKAKALHEEKRKEQCRRRFYKLVAFHGCYGKLDLREVRLNSDMHHKAVDWHCVEIISGDGRFSGTVRAYARATDKHRGGRPDLWYGIGYFRDKWEAWCSHSWQAMRAGEAAYARGEHDRFYAKLRNRAKQRRLSKAREARLKREEAARLEALRRSKLSSEIPFFQMMAGVESIAKYVKEQTIHNHEKK